MKKLIIPFLKLINVLFDCIVTIPVVFLFIVVLGGLWDFKFKSRLSHFKEIRYTEEYLTPLDYLKGEVLNKQQKP